MKELLHKRTRRARVFDLGNGQHRAEISSGAVHYQDDAGTWQPIRTRLLGDFSLTNNPYLRTEGDLMLRLPRNTRGVAVVHDRRGHTLAYKALNAATVQAVVETNVARYPEAWPGCTLEYHATPEGLKTLIRRTPGVSPTSFAFRVTGNTPLVSRESGFAVVDVVETVMVIPAPWATDANDELVGASASLAGDVLTLTCDPTATVLDPTTTIQPSSKDAQVSRRDDGLTAGDGTSTGMGVGRNYFGGYWTYRGLVQFDLSAITGVTTVNSAVLGLYATTVFGNVRTFNLYRVTQTWSETDVTWASQPTYDATLITSFDAGDLAQWEYADIRSAVSAWLVSGTANYGVLLMDNDETTLAANRYVSFVTRNNTTSLSERPKLTIDYSTGPAAPTVNPVDSDDTTVTGTAEAGSTVTVKVGGSSIGSAVANASTGAFSVTITPQVASTVLDVTATTTSEGAATSVTVSQAPPQAPTIATAIYDYMTTVIGTAEASSTVTIKVGSTLGTATADASTGAYSVTIAAQVAGTVLSVTATNAGGDSPATTTTVLDDEGAAVTTWATLFLNVMEYQRLPGPANTVEIPLIPDPTAATSVPQSVLMGTGRLRKRRMVRCWALIADLQALESDYYSRTAKSLYCPDGDLFTAVIERLDDITMRPGVTDRYWYSAVFVEK